ncbi:Guanine nucleotide exchange factor for Rab-3A [Armadillidium vulgare]|nr:Guanine nucleotide exchange factor for Rab-3A [Armadillidium vulgare]
MLQIYIVQNPTSLSRLFNTKSYLTFHMFIQCFKLVVMSVKVESEQDLLPAQNSFLKCEDISIDEWRGSIRACVTALKCHIMASKGLTPDGHIIEPYSPDILLKDPQNQIYLKDGNKEEIENYVEAAMAKLPSKDHNFHSDTVLEDVNIKVNEDSNDAGPPSIDQYFNISSAASFEKKFSNISLSSDPETIDEPDSAAPFRNSKELKEIKDELCKKTKEIEKLSRIRDEIENELQELTANLFQEAHSMVLGANQRAAIAEKSFKEASMQVEVLQAEVAALKALVITSTPSAPNHHLHPQLISKGAQAVVAEAGKIFQRGHKKSPSDFDLKYGRDTTPPSSPLKEDRLFEAATSKTFPLDPECWEVDPVLHREFVAWRQEPELCRNKPFHQQGIQKCVLLDVPRYCKYRFRLGEKDDTWYYISQLARNRIISVCDFLSYLRYIQLGLVKSSIHDDVYWEIVKLRRQMALARLGF